MTGSLPPPGKSWDDLQKWGSCRICGIPIFGWSPGRSDRCGRAGCERPVELLGPLPARGGDALRPYADRGEAAGLPQDDAGASRHG